MVSISDYSAIAKILDSASREGFTDKLSASTTIVDRYWLCLLLDLKRNHSEYDQLELFPLINPVKWINVFCFNKPTVPPTSLDWQNQYITCDVPKQWDSFMIQLFKTEECSPNTLHPSCLEMILHFISTIDGSSFLAQFDIKAALDV